MKLSAFENYTTVQHFDVDLRAMEVNRVVDHGRRFSCGEGALGIRHGPAANRFLSVVREQQPELVPTELKSKLDQGKSFGDNFTSDTFHIRHFRPFLDHDIVFAHRVPRAASLDYWGKSS